MTPPPRARRRKAGQWRLLAAGGLPAAQSRDRAVGGDHCLIPETASLYTAGCNLHYATAWIWAPKATDVTLERMITVDVEDRIMDVVVR